MDAVDDRLAVSEMLSILPEREQTIVYLRFFEGLTQSEIAEQIGISQMHVLAASRAQSRNAWDAHRGRGGVMTTARRPQSRAPTGGAHDVA